MSSACSRQGGSALAGAGSPRAQSVPQDPRPAGLGDVRNPALRFGHRVQQMHEHAESLSSTIPLPALFQKKEKIFAALIQG